mmetsp:Transcript_18375/g.16035  ORF Transcript_18375/g.16035 Transcript_18375/m.16035 type:complete len:102 (+) Transcript_18375:829-1134(+)
MPVSPDKAEKQKGSRVPEFDKDKDRDFYSTNNSKIVSPHLGTKKMEDATHAFAEEIPRELSQLKAHTPPNTEFSRRNETEKNGGTPVERSISKQSTKSKNF